MTRPRKEPIVLEPEKQLERLEEKVGRREMLQLLGAGSAAALAGCGGGGGEESPTATETPGGGETTPTGTPSPTETTTEAGYEVTDQWYYDLTGDNFEKINPNPWNAESATTLWPQSRFPLTYIPYTYTGPTPESAVETLLMIAAKRVEIDPANQGFTIRTRDDLEWGDGTPFNAENVVMHADILSTQIELGEQSESTMPLSIEATGEHTVEATLVPGNVIIRFLEAFWQGNLRNVSNTHPKHHKKFVENIRSATTTDAKEKAIQELLEANFSADLLPDFALGGFQASDWNPEEVRLESRTDFPWGLDYNPDMRRLFKGVRMQSTGEETQRVNAAIAGNETYLALPNKQVTQRFPEDEWKFYRVKLHLGAPVYFSPKSKFGKKTETARKMRQAVAYYLDARETAQVNDLVPTYEQSAGFVEESNFQNWIGDDAFLNNWTNYGHADTGYSFPEKGDRALRRAGFERDKDGTWVDAGSGEPLAPEHLAYINKRQGHTRPVIDNIVEQLNRNGINASGSVLDADRFDSRMANYDFDLALTTNNYEMVPHPYFAFREDAGLGSKEGLPAGVWYGDWRTGYRRVEVPMPIGDPDGDLQTVDWDTTVEQMAQTSDTEKMARQVRKLCWTLNQWVPGVIMMSWSMLHGVNTTQVQPTDDLNPQTLILSNGPMFNLPAGFFRPA